MMIIKYLLVFSCILQASVITQATLKASKPVYKYLRTIGLWLAAHKYFDVDRRKGNEQSWKYEERVYYKHFPLPRLKKLHPEVSQQCKKNFVSCMNLILSRAMSSYTMHGINVGEVASDILTSKPFQTHLELFQFRTAASYYMCWYTIQRTELLKNFMEGQNCLLDLDKVLDRFWVDYEVVDYRTDSPGDPFLCATILFCPDPCYGHQTGGSVPSPEDMLNDVGNPCRHLKDRSCKWEFSQNSDLESLQRNKLNITCNCAGDRKGFEWNSRFELCVDTDECQNVHTKCDKGRKCENTVGSFECLCPRGQKFDHELDKCVEHAPLPEHSFSRTGKVKAHRQKTAFMRMVEYILGLRKDSEP